MNEKIAELFSLVSKMTYKEWVKASHSINRAFEEKIISSSNAVRLDEEVLKRRFELDN